MIGEKKSLHGDKEQPNIYKDESRFTQVTITGYQESIFNDDELHGGDQVAIPSDKELSKKTKCGSKVTKWSLPMTKT